MRLSEVHGKKECPVGNHIVRRKVRNWAVFTTKGSLGRATKWTDLENSSMIFKMRNVKDQWQNLEDRSCDCVFLERVKGFLSSGVLGDVSLVAVKQGCWNSRWNSDKTFRNQGSVDTNHTHKSDHTVFLLWVSFSFIRFAHRFLFGTNVVLDSPNPSQLPVSLKREKPNYYKWAWAAPSASLALPLEPVAPRVPLLKTSDRHRHQSILGLKILSQEWPKAKVVWDASKTNKLICLIWLPDSERDNSCVFSSAWRESVKFLRENLAETISLGREQSWFLLSTNCC